MENYDWISHLKLVFFFLKLMGLWPSDGQTYDRRNLYTIYSVLLYTFCIIIHMLPQIINLYFVRNNLEAVATIIYIGTVEVLGAIKSFFLIKNNKILKKCVDVINSDWFQPKNEKQIVIIKPTIGVYRIASRILFLLSFATATFLTIYPLFDGADADGNRRFTYMAWYPYDAQKSPYYELTYLAQTVSNTYLAMTHILVDTLIAGLAAYSGCQFDLLSDNIRNFCVQDNQEASYAPGKKLIECIVHHKNILSYISYCTQFFKWIMIWILILTGVTIGITLFELTVVVPFTFEFYCLITLVFAVLLELLMFCWFGNELKEKSDLVSYAVFESDWTHLSKDVLKNLLIFTENVLEPVKLSAFNIFELTLDTFKSIIKTSWSYFTLLTQMSS